MNHRDNAFNVAIRIPYRPPRSLLPFHGFHSSWCHLLSWFRFFVDFCVRLIDRTDSWQLYLSLSKFQI
jgi:hypothetical protein